jgi:hypothetical protein
MNPETKICQNCKHEFTIEPEDFNFYEKIKVPPPTFCPECRMQRRMAWRNVRNLYKSPCRAPEHNEVIVSIYSSEKPFMVFDQSFWWGDQWDPLNYGMVYDFSRPFLEQFKDLLSRIPLPNVNNANYSNSNYINMTIDSKNCYLVFSSTENEDCSYSEGINNCRNCLDLLSCRQCEYSYNCIDCRNSFNIAFAERAISCVDSTFLYDCRNCSNCFGCWNLRNKKYHIFNEPFSKEEYEEKIQSFDLNNHQQFLKMKDTYKKKLQKAIHKFADIVNSKNVTGNGIEFSDNCHNTFDISNTKNSKYIWRFLEKNGSDNYDITVATRPELCYECHGVGSSYNSKFGIAATYASNSHYVHTCISNSEYLFGCVGLNNKSYCILNKQYTKEQYEELVPKIIQHMNDMPYIDAKGRVYKYGEFFPPELSPFCYNETVAQEYFPLTKEEALKQGYKWKDKEERNYTIDIKTEDIPNDIKDAKDDIIGKVIECEHKDCNEQCTEGFKIIESELSFYRRMNLPLPHLCPNCRHYQRLKQRNPLKLWHRKCMKEGCPNEFKTSYAPEREEIVYCERCYNQEVY